MARSYSAKQKRLRVKVEGADKIVKALKDMEDGASKVLSAAAKAGGQIALSDAKRNCPVDTGALRDSLKMETCIFDIVFCVIIYPPYEFLLASVTNGDTVAEPLYGVKGLFQIA